MSFGHMLWAMAVCLFSVMAICVFIAVFGAIFHHRDLVGVPTCGHAPSRVGNPLGEMCSRGRLDRVLACLRGRDRHARTDDGGGGKMTIGPVQLMVAGSGHRGPARLEMGFR